MRFLIVMVSASLLVWTGPAPAQDRPALYRVVNVDQTDTLSIRATASPTSAIIGELAPDATHVEILEARHGWGRIVAGEGEAWVNMAFLTAMTRPPLPGFSAPGGLQCAGTEPFWGLTIGTGGEAAYFDGETLGAEIALTVSDARTARARPDLFVYHFEGEAQGVAIVRAGTCSDGMSDRRYGWQAFVDMRSEDGVSRLVEGCCFTPSRN